MYLYKPKILSVEQGTTVRMELGDCTTTADPASDHVIRRLFPRTYGQHLAHFLRATAKVPDAQIITELPIIRFVLMPCFYSCNFVVDIFKYIAEVKCVLNG